MSKYLNKSSVTNLVSILIIALSFISPWGKTYLFNIGFFAFSGAITNWIAVHMLFEKVPYLYGSGVIPLHFKEFKTAIHKLMMEQFFSHENIEKFLSNENFSNNPPINFDVVLKSIDYNDLYDELVNAILTSPFGPMISMFGGKNALVPLREPLMLKMTESLTKISKTENFKQAISKGVEATHLKEDLLNKVQTIVATRLEELTPDLVKQIIQEMIREHLGWLVIWGGVFGGLIGLAMNIAQEVIAL